MTTTWDVVSTLSSFPKLKGNMEVDVAIIGGGITGITSAYLLSDSNKKIALFEANKLCSGATGATTGFITQSIDTDYTKLISMFGNKNSRLIAESHMLALDKIEEIIKKEKIDCEYVRCSNYFYAIDNKELPNIKKEKKSMDKIGIKSEIVFKPLGFLHSCALEFKNQAKFHPLKYLSSLASKSVKNGVKIFEYTRIIEVKKDGMLFVLKHKGGIIKAKIVIMATYAPIDKALFFKKAFYDSYIFELRIPKNLIKEATFEDTQNPYHYFRIDTKDKFDRMLIGGEDHRSDIKVSDKKCFKSLEKYIKDIFPALKYKIIKKWKGPIIEPVDGIAFIGKIDKEELYYATGFSGNGITYSTIASMIIANNILGKSNNKLKNIEKVYLANRVLDIKNLAYKGTDYTAQLFGVVKNSLKFDK